MNNSELTYEILTYIPQGRVLTYQRLAQLVGIKSPRVIGNILHRNPDPIKAPCYKVVSAQGRVAEKFGGGGAKVQAQKLKRDGVKFVNGKVDLSKHLWELHQALTLYFKLLRKYGAPGPWPWFDQGDPQAPEEIALGSILTQNTNWKNVEYALKNLRKENVCSIKGIYQLGQKDYQKLEKLIRPSGYYRQKAKRLFNFTQFIVDRYKTLGQFFKLSTKESRQILLSLNGIGKETADTILLYAGQKPIFVIDAYTKRFVQKHNLGQKLDYDSLQQYFTQHLPKRVDLYQDYHALIIKWGQEN